MNFSIRLLFLFQKSIFRHFIGQIIFFNPLNERAFMDYSKLLFREVHGTLLHTDGGAAKKTVHIENSYC